MKLINILKEIKVKSNRIDADKVIQLYLKKFNSFERGAPQRNQIFHILDTLPGHSDFLHSYEESIRRNGNNLELLTKIYNELSKVI
jgi:hypothetical protein